MVSTKFLGIVLLSTTILWSCKSEGDKPTKDVGEIGEVSISVEGGNIYGSLEGDNSETVLMVIAGSGQTDRDGGSGGAAGNSLKLLGEHVVDAGYSVFRYDKRTAGESYKEFAGTAVLFDDFINDAAACVDYLKETGFNNIVVAGHSQGSLIGMKIAQAGGIAGYISIAGPARDIDALITDQIVRQSPQFESEVVRMFQELKDSGKTLVKSKPLEGLFNERNQPFIVNWMSYNPAEELTKVTVPILIINGKHDVQVGTEEAVSLAEVSGTEPLIIDSMNHIFRNAPAEFYTNIATYSDLELPINKQFISAVVNFISECEESKK